MLQHKLDEKSGNSVSSALDLFSTPLTNVSFSSWCEREELPLNPIPFPLKNAVLNFKVKAGPCFLDLHNSYFLMQFRIWQLTDAGRKQAPDAATQVIPIQGIAATCVNNLRVTLNGRSTFNSNQLYAYRAYFDMLLGHSVPNRFNRLPIAGWFENAGDPRNVNNSSVKRAAQLFGQAKKVQCKVSIFADIFQQQRLMIPQVELGLELRMNEDDFTIVKLSDTDLHDYQLELCSCRLYMRCVNLSDGLALSINEELQRQPARYPVRRVEMKTDFINSGRMEYSSSLFTENTPKKLFAALVPAANYKGTQLTSPFLFGQHNVTDIHVRMGGNTYPNILYRPIEWDERGFLRILDDLWAACDPVEIGITPDMFATAHTIYAFNLSNYMTDEGTWDLTVQGQVSIHITFGDAVPNGGLQLIVMAVSDALILIDQYRSITTDLNA